MSILSSRQRQFLKRLAHPLSPIVRVGKGGVTETVITETKRSLKAHELIKVRIEAGETSQRRSLAEQLADAAGAQLAGTVGKIAILYRAREEKPVIKLP